jgi:hypothetical protein
MAGIGGNLVPRQRSAAPRLLGMTSVDSGQAGKTRFSKRRRINTQTETETETASPTKLETGSLNRLDYGRYSGTFG